MDRSFSESALGRSDFPALLILAFLLRALGIHYGLPHVYHQDEPMMVHHALAVGTGDWNTHYFVIPPFVSYFLFFVYGTAFILARTLGIFSELEDFALFFLTDPTLFYLAGRLFLPVFFGTLTVAVLSVCASRYFSRKAAGLAALFLALSPIHVQHSHYIYADIPVTLVCTLLFFRILRLSEKPKWKNYLSVALLLGWGTAVKYNAAYFVPLILIGHGLAHGQKALSPKALGKLLTAGFLSVLFFALLAPYTFLDWTHFAETLERQSAGESFVGWTHHLVYSIGNGIGPFVLLLALLGCGVAVKKNFFRGILLLSGILIFYVIHVFFAQHYARYTLPVIPLLCLSAGLGWEYLWERLKSFPPLRLLGLTAIILSLAAPSLTLDYLFFQKDTRTLCTEWFEDRVNPGAVVVMDHRFFGPRLAPSRDEILSAKEHLGIAGLDRARRLRIDLLSRALEGKKTYRVRILAPEGVPETSEFILSGPFIPAEPQAVVNLGPDYLIFNEMERDERSHRLKETLRPYLELTAIFSPYRSPEMKRPLDPHATTAGVHRWSELFRRQRLGPYLEVYRFKKNA